MPAENKKLELRSLLAGKTTEELEELLALDFAEDKAKPDADYISTILEVIEERENSTEERNEQTLNAWSEFQAYRKEAESHESLEAGKSEKPTHNHRRIIEYRQKPRKNTATLRIIAVAAAAMVLLCSTAFAFNLWQIIVEWTEETFYFLTGQKADQLPQQETLDLLRVAVSDFTELPMVPHRAPEGTMEYGNLNITERENRCSIGMGYRVQNRQFTIRIVVYTDIQDIPFNTYQKDATIHEKYTVNSITHYIVGNNQTLSVMWTNGSVEGHIQGNLTIDEMRQMIDSIYEE